MKRNDYINRPSARRITARRRSAYLLMLALAGITLLAAACTKDDAGSIPGDDTQPTPVRLIAGIQHTATPAPATRTAPGGTDGTQTVWTKDDQIGLFMLPAGGKIPADTLPAAHNVPYSIDPATGVMTQAVPQVYDPVTDSWSFGVLIPMYYPSTDEAVDFVAYYPYEKALEIDFPLIPPYILPTSLQDQTTTVKQSWMDILYSDNARNIHRSKDAVQLQFRHLMAKLRLDITLAEGLAGGDVTKVTLPGMPYSVYFDMRDGSVNKIDPPLDFYTISCLRLPSPAAGTGADATFTAIVPPHEGAKFNGRKITVTVDGMDYTGTIPDADAYSGNTMYAYPVRVTPRGITIGAPNTDVPWTDAQPLPQGYDLTIANETELRRFAGLVNTGGELPNGTPAAEAKVLQTADIKLTVTQEWTPIGNGDNWFRGAYNGDGHTITGLTITTAPQPDANNDIYAGLFGRTEGAVLTGIHLREVEINIRAGSGVKFFPVGSIVGVLSESTLSLCSATGTVNAGGAALHVYAGGIAGINPYSTISRCRASVKTTATTTRTDGSGYAGEIAGANFTYSFILSCEAGGMPVTAGGGYQAIAGGIAGSNSFSCLIAFCRTGANTVAAQGASDYNYAGGLVGNNAGYLYSCYSRAEAKATGGTENQAGAITGSFFTNAGVRQFWEQYCYATGATGPGTSGLAADPANGIYYETSPGNGDIFDAVTAYTGVVESIAGFGSFAGNTYYPTATRHTPATAPAHGILPVRVKWTRAAWQHGINTTYPEINMEYGGEDAAAAP